MLSAGFFARFGFFVVPEFFDAESCTRLRLEMQSAGLAHVSVGDAGGDVVDEKSRSAGWAKVSADSCTRVRNRLRDLKPRLERHFRMRLRDCQTPQFLVYAPGDFYVAHSDSGDQAKSPRYVAERRVSVVVFLNGPSERVDSCSYQGGSLTFCGLIDDERLESSVYPLLAEPGLLVAFRSELFHAVTPVTRGRRYTVASWFTG